MPTLSIGSTKIADFITAQPWHLLSASDEISVGALGALTPVVGMRLLRRKKTSSIKVEGYPGCAAAGALSANALVDVWNGLQPSAVDGMEGSLVVDQFCLPGIGVRRKIGTQDRLFRGYMTNLGRPTLEAKSLLKQNIYNRT